MTTLRKESQGVAWSCAAFVEKFDDSQVRWVRAKTGIRHPSGAQMRQALGRGGYELVDAGYNLVTQHGLAFIVSILSGVSTTTTSHILSNGFLPVGVSDGGGSVPTVSVLDTALSGSVNKYFQPVDATFPQPGLAGSSAGNLTIQATFPTTAANFAWNDWAIFGVTSTYTAGGSTTPGTSTMINHKGIALGTKSSSDSWVFTATITLA